MINTETERDDYSGNGTTADFDYTFKIFDESHLVVIVTDSDGAESDLVLNVDYTVDQDTIGDDTGGSISLIDNSQLWIDGSGFLDTGFSLTIMRDIPYKQETDIRNQGEYYPEAHENALDKIVMLVQQLKDISDRAIKAPRSEPDASLELPSVESRANSYFAFDADGNPIASDRVVDTALVTAYMETLLDDTTAAQARSTLGFSGAGGTVATAQIEDSAVTTIKIAAQNITTAKLADLAVTLAKMDTGFINDMTSVTPASDDYVSIADTSDSNNVKKAQIDVLKRTTYRDKSSTSSAIASDEGINLSGASFTFSLLTAVGNSGKEILLRHTGTSISQIYMIDSAGGNVDGASSTTLNTNGETLRLRSDGTDWVRVYRYVPTKSTAFTPTGSWSSNTTYTGTWSRRGQFIDLDIKVAVTGAPTSASLTIDLPITINTTDLLDTTAGVAGWRGSVCIRDSGTDNFIGFIRYNSTTTIAIFKDDGDGTVSAVTQAAPMTFASGDFVHIQVSGIPVSGWKN